MAELCAVLEESCLVPFLEHQLRDETIMDMMKRETMFHVLLTLMKEMAKRKELMFLVGPLEHQKASLAQLMKPMTQKANLYLKAVKGQSREADLAR